MTVQEKKSGFWNVFRSAAKVDAPTHLEIRSAGLCCAVGYNLDSATCGIRANMDHFQQSEFKVGQKEKVLVARLADDDIWGQARLAKWIALAIADCMAPLGQFDPSTISLIWIAPEPERSGADSAWYADVFTEAVTRLEMQFHERSGILPLGRAGLSNALGQASQLLEEPGCRYVLMVGADTYLNATTINAYLAAERLQVPGNSDGFIPGEAAAAVLLQKPRNATDADASSVAPLMHITGFGIGDEPGRPDGSVPSRGRGLTQAIRHALDASNYSYSALQFRVSDQNGESFFSREAANALTRVAPSGARKLSLITLADCIGEVGAATGPAMLAYLSRLLPGPGSPGSCGLLHLANDNGVRNAVVVHYPIA